MTKEWTLQNAVKKFKPAQGESLKKSKGNLNSRQFESLVKEIKRYYEEVEYKGRGRNRIIITNKKRKVMVEKEDKRKFNKGTAPPHSKNLALMVMSKMNDVDDKARTINTWATYFGLISHTEQEIMNGIFSTKTIKPYKEYFIERNIFADGEEKVLEDLSNTLRKVSRNQLRTVLRQGEKLQLISLISSWKVKIKGSSKPFDIKDIIAEHINSTEAELLKKHGINKSFVMMFKNSPKTKAFNVEWLKYIDNIELDIDAEEIDDPKMEYIYQVHEIVVRKDNVLDEFMAAHYPFDTDTFVQNENRMKYDKKLIEYVVREAQKVHERKTKPKEKQLKIDKETKELLAILVMSEEEYIGRNNGLEIQKEQTPYELLVKSDRYVKCIKDIHIQLHGMHALNSSPSVKIPKPAAQMTMEEEEMKLRARLNKQQVKSPQIIQVANHIRKHDEFIPYSESYKELHSEYEDEHRTSIEDIRDEIRQNEAKYGDKAMQRMTLNRIIADLSREVTIEDFLGANKNKREKHEWEEELNVFNPVKVGNSKNNPLEHFYRHREHRIDKEDS